MKFNFDRSIAGFVAAVVLMAALGLASLNAINQQVATAHWVEHSQEVIDRMQALLTEIERASTDVRGYFLTRDETFRQALGQLRVGVPVQLDALQELTSDNAARRSDVPLLRQAIDGYLGVLDREIAQFTSAYSVGPDLQRNNRMLLGIETQVHAIQADERQLLKGRIERARAISVLAKGLIEVGSGFALLIVLVSAWLLDRANRARQRVEDSLRESEQRFRLMIASVKDYAIIMLDAAGHVISWNSGAERIKGYAAAKIIGRHFSCFYPEEKRREGFPGHALGETIRCGHFEDEGPRVRADGTTFLANVVINAVKDDDGELLGFVKVTRDVTESREIEQRVQKLNEDLQQRVRQLETSNKELEAFSYSVSHDLRAPLRHIAGFVELLQKSPAIEADPSSQRYVRIIAKAAKQMGVLIDDLLAFSRTGRSEMRLSRLDMREIVDGAISDLQEEWKGRKVAWDIQPLEPVQGDPHLLRLVWTNLISNALKYTRPREEAHIEIGQEKKEAASNGHGQGDNEVVYYVRDNGVGFSMEYAHKLFGGFQRLHRADEFEGTGIGLANVQRIIQRHGGHVWAEGKLNIGSIFNFSLPRNRHPSGPVLCQN